MAQVKMPDGQVVELPDNPSPEELAFLQSQVEGRPILDTIKDTGKSLWAGFQKTVGEGIKNVLPLAGYTPLGNVALQGNQELASAVLNRTGQRTVNAGQEIGDESQLPRFPKAMAEAVGGSAIVPTAAPVRAGIAAAGGGAGAEKGQELAGPLGGVLGSIVGGAGAGFAAAPRQSPVRAEIRSTLGGVDEAGWNAASRNLDNFAAAGSKTATLPEAFEGNNALLALAIQARGRKGAEGLTNRVAGRSEDLTNLGKTAMDRVTPKTPEENVGYSAAQAADNRLGQFRQHRTNQYKATIDKAPDLDPSLVQDLHSTLVAAGKATQSTVEKEAFEAVANTLLQANKASVPQPPKASIGTTKGGFKVAQTTPQPDAQVDQPKTDIKAAAMDLKQLQDDLEVNDFASGGKKLDAAAVKRVYGVVNDYLRTISPHFAKAEDDYRKFSRRLVNPATSGQLGQVAGRNFDPNRPVPESRVGQISSPQVLESLAKGSSDPDLKKKIVRLLMERKLAKGPADVGGSVRGSPGSIADSQFQDLLKAADADAAGVNQPLLASDQLQGFNAPVGARGVETNSALASLVTPFSTVARRARLGQSERDASEISRLLSNPTKEALAELRKIAAFDPTVRRQLMLRGVMAPHLLGESE